MALNWGVTDILAVTKLAWDLYHNCYLVAREAPDEFRQLVNELASLELVLRTLRDDISSDKSFLDRLGENRKQTLERALTTCFDTLNKIQKLVVKYRELGLSDGLQFWKRLKWVGKQSQIGDLKAKIMAHTCHISLCMSSIGNSSLARIESSIMQAMEQQDKANRASRENEDEVDELTPLIHSKTVPAQTEDSDGLGLRGIDRVFTGTTLSASITKVPQDSTPPLSEVDGLDIDTSKSCMPTNKLRKTSAPTTDRDHQLLPSSPRSSDDYTNGSIRSYPSRKDFLQSGESSADVNDLGAGEAHIVIQAVAEAMKELSKIKHREQSSRPLRLVPEDPDRRPNSMLSERFHQLADEELQIRRLNVKDWLIVATWWLLKARFTMRTSERSDLASSRASFSICADAQSPANQAYVDLLKASWILHKQVRKEENLSSLTTDENRKLFYNLSDAIKDQFNMYQPVDKPETDTFLEQNHNIWELLQPEEEAYDEQDFLRGLDNGRWITVEQDDAGEEHETVLFRTFVNATIGGKRYRMKSKGAPYMLVLSTKEGESEPKVTICNQSGTFGLTRDFTIEDLYSSEIPTNYSADGSQFDTNNSIPLNFERMNTVVTFTNEYDFQKFMDIPRAYFNAVRRREPRHLENATETLLFKRSVEIFEQLKASTVKPMIPRKQYQSCDLRVLDTTGREGWRTTRRIVISSSAAEKHPWLKEFFLPLSRVQINREDIARQVKIKWSDCNYEKPDLTDGNYNPVYSYIYDDSNPNIALRLLFRNSEDATDFENTILRLSMPPIFSWPTGGESRFIYDIHDADPNPKNYKAFLLIHTRFNWRYSDLFYVYRDSDYQFDSNTSRIYFPEVIYTDYISTHVDKCYKPDADKPPRFSHCEKRIGNVAIDFGDPAVAMSFMSSLTNGYELIFSRRSHFITTKVPSRFGSAKSNKGNAEIQLWQKGNTMRLVSRWGDKVEDKWMSMTIPKGGLEQRNDSNRAIFRNLEYDRGRKIDLGNVMAREFSHEKSEKKKTGMITIAFETVRDREEFAATLEGMSSPQPPISNPFDDLITMMT